MLKNIVTLKFTLAATHPANLCMICMISLPLWTGIRTRDVKLGWI